MLFNNAISVYTDPYMIQTAMYGYEQAEVQPARTGNVPTLLDQGFAPRNDAEIRADKHQRLSAVVTMFEFLDRDDARTLGLVFYHNRFADHPFSPQWWIGENIGHWVLSEKTPGGA